MSSSAPRTTRSFLIAAVLAATAAGCGQAHESDIEDHEPPGYADETERGDRHNDFGENTFIDADDDTSTFSVDVNNASYTMMRRELDQGRLPEPEGVRTEEFINFFRFDYPEPDGDRPFSINTEVAPSHFGSTDDQQRHMMRIGLKGQEVSLDEMNPTNLVLLVDVSGSMDQPDRFPLVRTSLHTLVDHLRPSDSVAIQSYANDTETVLEPTDAEHQAEIEDAIDSMSPGGGTRGDDAIIQAYDMAEDALIEDGNNRVIILTDGDFNVGKTGDDLIELVKERRDRNISLTAAGYGLNNDATMERLARKGKGNYFYVDNDDEATRIFGAELPSTIQAIAQDVRAQVQFNADVVDRYRLVGYERRVMDDDEFDDEDTDAGEIGAGHTVTGFYELELEEETLDAGVDQLPGDDSKLAEVAVRHKEQYGEETLETTRKVDEVGQDFQEASDGFRFATAVGQFAGILRESAYVQDADFQEVHEVAEDSMYDGDPHQQEFLSLVDTASQLWEDAQ